VIHTGEIIVALYSFISLLHFKQQGRQDEFFQEYAARIVILHYVIVFHDIPKVKRNFISVDRFFLLRERTLCHDGNNYDTYIKTYAYLIFNLLQKPISKI
jgi:hypothetical protein